MIHDRPPRLRAFDYLGLHRYHLRVSTWNRRPHFDSAAIVREAREQLLQHASEFGFAIHAYCFMPDHVHVLLEGERPDACLLLLVARWKQQTAFDFRQRHRQRLWQPGFFDRVLREWESSRTVSRYILENPVRAGLVLEPSKYPYSGCTWGDDVTLWD